MSYFYKKFLEKNIDLSVFGLFSGEGDLTYFCTPKNSKIIGNEGVDGIHYCFVKGYKDAVFAVNPSNAPEDSIHIISKNFKDFLSLLISCKNVSPIEQIWFLNKKNYTKLVKDVEKTKEVDEIINQLTYQLKLTPINDPYNYVKNLQKTFDYSKLKFEEEYYQSLDAYTYEENLPKTWKVYYDGSFTETYSNKKSGKEIKLDKTFRYKNLSWFIPAIYSCSDGIVMDIIIKIPKTKIKNFIKKWKIDENSQYEDFDRITSMRIEAENPLNIDFDIDLKINNKTTNFERGTSATYSPLKKHQDNTSKWIINHYSLDENSNYIIERRSFPWATKKKPKIKNISLSLSYRKKPQPGNIIEINKPNEEFILQDPITKINHKIKIISYENHTVDEKIFNMPDYYVPTNCKIMSYCIEPHADIQIADLNHGDNPKPKEIDHNSFYAVSTPGIGLMVRSDKESRASCSSLYFDLPEKINWYSIFHYKNNEKIEIKLI